MLNVILDNIIYSLQKSGGISVYWHELIERMKDDQEITLKMLEYSDAKNNIFRKQVDIDSHLVELRKSFPHIYFHRYFNPRKKVQDKTIFHSSYYRTLKSKNCMNIVTVFDFTYEKKIKNITGMVHIIQKRHAIKKADGIICISENTRKDLIDIYPKFKNKNMKVIYIAHNAQHYYRLPDEQMDQSVVFVGARKGYKNFRGVVNTLSEMRDINLKIVGAPLDQDEVILLNKKMSDRYQMYTHIDDIRLNQLYNQSICLMYLSEYEGFGIPLLEAMSAGCPVIALDKSSIPEVVGTAGLFFKDLDYKAIRSTIYKLRDDLEYRNHIIKLGCENAARFSWDQCYQETVQFYKELLN